MNTSLHATSSWRAAFRRQLRLPLESGRVWLLFSAAVLILLGEEVLTATDGRAATIPSVVQGMHTTTLLGIGWALLIWYDERKAHRTYHWSLPLAAWQHDLTRVAAGVVWLLAASAIFCTLGVVLAFSAGLGPRLSLAPALFWVQCFTSPLLFYMLASVAALRTDRPLEVMTGVLLLVFAIGFLLEFAIGAEFVDSLRAPFDEPYGLTSAAFAGEAQAGRRIAIARLQGEFPATWVRYVSIWGPPTTREAVIAMLWFFPACMLMLFAGSYRRPRMRA